tara:strand:- start:55 stop:489 length:435 start_codon:yes stop_codon:yes gene_type:complete
MASTLKINTLTGVSTAGSIAVTGEGNSTTTNLQQGLLKCWANIDMESSTQVFNDSFNTSGVTDNGAGRSEIAFSNNFNNGNYAGGGINKDGSGYNDSVNLASDASSPMTTSAFEIFTTHGGSSANSYSGNDAVAALVVLAGDLA